MAERQKITLAVYLILLKAGSVLLLRRANTGWEDGNYSLIAGHVDAGETAREALIREAKEEVGIIIAPGAVKFAHSMHRKDATNYLDLYFACAMWQGESALLELEKADDLRWFRLDALPGNIVGPVRQALTCLREGVAYSEHGWSTFASELCGRMPDVS